MKSIIVLLLLVTLHAQTSAQKLPSFGKIDKEEFKTKECSYDNEATAEYLLDVAEVRYYFTSSDFVNETTTRIRIKILNEKAIELANVRIPYYSVGNRQRIRNIEGQTFNLNASGEVEVTKLEKKSVMEQKLGSESEMMVFTLPNVKVGSVIEYRYEDSKRNYIEIEDWVFQRPYPVRYSEYNVEIPKELEFTYMIKRSLPVKETTEGINQTKRFIMVNIPGLDREPFMSSSKDYLQRIDFQLRAINGQPRMTTWAKLTEQVLESESFGLQIKKNVYKNTPLPAELKSLTDPYQKFAAILNYVKKEVTWNGKSSIWTDEGIKNAVDKHSGNSADMNLLLVSLLRDAGLKAYPVLVSTRSNGKVNATYPFLYQFNDVYVYAEINQTPYVIDATNYSNPPFLIPWDVQFTEGFLVDQALAQFIPLGDVKHRFRLVASILGEITPEGKVNGSANIVAYEYAKNERLATLRKGEKNYLEEYFTKPYPEFKFDSLTYKNEKNDSLPLENLVHFQGSLSSSGDYLFYSPNFLMELEKNEFISDKRFTDIEFGYMQYYNMFTTLRFPQGFELEELPKNIRMILPDTSVSLQRFVSKNENSISMRYTLEIKRPTYYADEYLDFKAFYAKLFEMLNEQIVFKRKTTPKP
jgi:transglutaminase-like putative cysteine protease